MTLDELITIGVMALCIFNIWRAQTRRQMFAWLALLLTLVGLNGWIWLGFNG